MAYKDLFCTSGLDGNMRSLRKMREICTCLCDSSLKNQVSSAALTVSQADQGKMAIWRDFQTMRSEQPTVWRPSQAVLPGRQRSSNIADELLRKKSLSASG